MPEPLLNILVVDDDPLGRVVLSSYLEDQGYTVVQVGNGQEGLEELHSQAFDLLLLDILMPAIDEFAVLRSIRQDPRTHLLPVIVISALDEMDGVLKSIEMGADDYVLKPFEPSILAARIAACLEKRRPKTPRTVREVRMLIALTDRTSRLDLERILKPYRYPLTFVEDSPSALAALRSGEFDITLLDVHLPKINGQAVIRVLQEEGLLAKIPVMMVAPVTEMNLVMECIDLGAEDYLLEPFDAGILETRIISCLQRRRG